MCVQQFALWFKMFICLKAFFCDLQCCIFCLSSKVTETFHGWHCNVLDLWSYQVLLWYTKMPQRKKPTRSLFYYNHKRTSVSKEDYMMILCTKSYWYLSRFVLDWFENATALVFKPQCSIIYCITVLLLMLNLLLSL